MTLRTKLCWSFLACILIVFLPILAITETQLRPASEKQTLQQTSQLVNAKAAEVGSWLNQRISEIRIIHEFPGTQSLDFDQLRPYLSSLNEVLRQQYGNPEEAFAVGGVDGQGWINDKLTIDVHQRPYFIEAMATEQEYVISKPVISKSDAKPIFLICYPIRNENKEKIGFINGSVNLDKFTDILSSVSIYDGFSWIMNREGLAYTAAPEVFDEIQLTEEDLQALASQAEIAGYLKLDSDRSDTIFYASVPYAPGWLYCVQVSDAKLFSSFDQVVGMMVGFAFFLLICAALLAWRLSNSITAPLKRLEQSVLAVANGNLNTVFCNSGSDEIVRLGRSFNEMVAQLRQLINQVVSVQQQKRKAELRALQAQINPHFLYNTLDTIQWKALEHDAGEVSDMIWQLSQMFRIALNDGRELIPVADEIRHVESYLTLQKMRLLDHFAYTLSVEPGCSEILIPKLILQPLVENSLVHGLDRKRKDGQIAIEIRRQGELILLSVQDNGKGLDPQSLQRLTQELASHQESDHYGLYNINERLYLTYRDQYRLTLESPSGKGFRITLAFPAEEENTCFASL
ncbi:cache domain-containing sensor histidine kinase [Holdemania massiliensis]|uniref:cache domain-containing sensor histidine kinase n=1 Tax=Holdemania massiliensis TaxID=1468449 RepID=UPI001F05E6A5|nr:sensor histidine kinase [Holdemania massiliensis]MCH1939530.1 sensor histidine kinase [Holdemania massiliensis]